MSLELSKKNDPTGFLRFTAILQEGTRRGYSFDVCREVYERKYDEPCRFKPPGGIEPPKAPSVLAPARIDFETRSRCDLKACGAWAYAAHPSTSVLCMAYALADGTRGLWKPGEADPVALFEHIAAGGLVVAYNAEFETAIWGLHCVPVLGWPPVPARAWRDSMAKVAAMALPMSLESAGAALGLSIVKDTIGARAMAKLCKPRKPTKNDKREWFDNPKLFTQLYAYCRQDVEAEAAIDAAVPALSPYEQRVWEAHADINARGIQVDREGVNAALRMIDLTERHYRAEVTKATGGVLKGEDLGSAPKVLSWCLSRGVSLANYQKATLSEALEGELPADVRSVLEARRVLGRAATKKYQAMLDRMGPDGRIRGAASYHGAATGRWAGRGVQLQNLAKGDLSPSDVDACLRDMADCDLDTFRLLWGDPMQAAASCVRGCLVAGPGKVLVAADYSAIEARVLNWLAEQNDIVAIFRTFDADTNVPKKVPDIYSVMAASIFRKSWKDVSRKTERPLGKITELGAGYGMGADKFLATCDAAGITLSEEQAKHAIDTYRATHPRVKSLWYEIDDAAIAATSAPGMVTEVRDGTVRFKHDGKHLWCRLPSGRKLCYPFAKVEERPTPWGEVKPAVHYWYVDSTTHQWVYGSTYGGALTENVVQAIARDLLADAILRCEAAGFPVVIHVHDEIVAEIAETSVTASTVHEFEALIATLPAWAAGLPVAAEGWLGTRYRK